MTLRDDLADWSDWDVAASSYGAAVGVFDGATVRQVRRVVLTDNTLAAGLHDGVMALVAAGVLEHRTEPDEQFRWAFAGPGSLVGAEDGAHVDDKPVALRLPDLEPGDRESTDEESTASGSTAEEGLDRSDVAPVDPVYYGGDGFTVGVAEGGDDDGSGDDPGDSARRPWWRRGPG